MRRVAQLHRWTGALLGLLLALIGLSGTLLLWKGWWVAPARRLAPPADPAAVLEAAAGLNPAWVLLGSEAFAPTRLARADGSGAYLDAAGQAVAAWHDSWARPELWLFDLHHRLFAGEAGEAIAGLLGIAGLLFVATGLLLWWRTRRSFEPRLWPRRLTAPAILRHHRDLGALAAPLLLVVLLTGTMLALKPVAHALLGPLSPPGALTAALEPPQASGGPATAGLPIRAMLAEAGRRFPGAQPRMLVWPKRPGDLAVLRLRQPGEWHPNGRTTLWFDPADGRLVEARDARALPRAARAFNALYPLHAGGVGALPWKLALTAAGLALTLLGSLAVWSFWRGRLAGRRPAAAAWPS